MNVKKIYEKNERTTTEAYTAKSELESTNNQGHTKKFDHIFEKPTLRLIDNGLPPSAASRP